MIKHELLELKRNLQETIYRHDKFKNAYFWNPCSNASGRRNAEKRNNFSYKNNRYAIKVENKYSESCKNVYYSGYFEIEGKKVTIIKIKNLLKALEQIC